MNSQYKLVEKLEIVRDKASKHKKALRYHRRMLSEYMGIAGVYEKQLAELGIKLEIHSQGGNNGKEKPST